MQRRREAAVAVGTQEGLAHQARRQAVRDDAGAMSTLLLKCGVMDWATGNERQLKQRRVKAAFEALWAVSKIRTGFRQAVRISWPNKSCTHCRLSGMTEPGDFRQVKHIRFSQIQVELPHKD